MTPVVALVAVLLLGGCVSVPAVRGPEPHTPGARQKTISELLTQWADLTDAAIAATGHTEGWFSGAILDNRPWDPAAENLSIWRCSTRGSKDASQLASDVSHDPFERDPHPIADKMTAYWEGQGFTVTRTIDWTDPTGGQSIEMRAERADGVQYGLTATNEIVAIDVATECSDHPSIQEWTRKRSLRDLKAPPPSPDRSHHTGTRGRRRLTRLPPLSLRLRGGSAASRNTVFTHRLDA